ncbi:MAG: SDR family oxidoreductase [Anaerolineales bacterium]
METIKDKVVVITGATRGFGYAIAEAMLKAGATVVISGRKPEALEKALNGLQAWGPVSGESCDVRDEAQVYALARAAVARHGRMDIWVNNAGYSAAAGRVLEMDPAEALDMFKVNALGTLYGAQAAVRHGAKVLVNLYGAGSNGKASSPTGLYAASKAWVTSFTRTLAKEMAGTDLQILAFNPGMMLTDMLTRPVVVGERGREMMKPYGFVLRFLARRPEQSAEELVKVLSGLKKPFTEYRVLKPWTPFLGLLRVTWENITHSGQTPAFELQFKEPYRFGEER